MTELCLRQPGELRSEIEIKRSRFIAIARRVSSVTQARDLQSAARAQFPDARHHCFAYVVRSLGASALLHSSDDGEPAGTAGRPMLDVLTGHDLVDLAVVVVRYFGGTLLGTGGLVRAYSDAVRAVLSGAELAQINYWHRVQISSPHASAGKLEAELRARDFQVLAVEYGVSQTQIQLGVPDLDVFKTAVASLTSGGGQVLDLGLHPVETPAGHFPTWSSSL